jgi:hypothetical protein
MPRAFALGEIDCRTGPLRAGGMPREAASGIARRRAGRFFDFRNFSALRRFADADRRTAERDSQGEGLARHSRPLPPCRRKGSQRPVGTVPVFGVLARSFFRLSAAASVGPRVRWVWALVP